MKNIKKLLASGTYVLGSQPNYSSILKSASTISTFVPNFHKWERYKLPEEPPLVEESTKEKLINTLKRLL